MPFARPTLTQLRDGALADVVASLIFDGTTGLTINPVLLQFDPLTILAKTLAGQVYEEYGYLDWISLQATPFTATDEAALAWGALVGVSMKPATAATGTAQFTNNLPTAVDIPLGTQMARSDGVLYASTADVLIPASSTGLVPYEAVTPGALTTIAAGSALSLTAGIAGITSAGVVTLSTAPGSDLETDDAFRARYLAQFNQPPHGGSRADYIEWALAVPGVTRAWVLGSSMGPGTVGLYVMFDGAEAGVSGFPVGTNGVSPLDNNGAPRDLTFLASGDQRTVADALIPLQPVTALVYVLAPNELALNVTVSGFGAANTASNLAAIRAGMTALLLSIATPLGMTIQLPQIIGAILAATGVSNFVLVAPASAVVVPTGTLPVLGTVTIAS